MNKKEKYIDNSGDRKYFAMIPYYIVNHSTAYEQSLYLVMKRIASEEGTCWASASAIGEIMGVSANTVRKYRDKLINRGWIKCVGKKGITKPTYEFEVVDLWQINMDFYNKKESAMGEQSKKKVQIKSEKVHLVSLESATGEDKEETMKKKQEEDIYITNRVKSFNTDTHNNIDKVFIYYKEKINSGNRLTEGAKQKIKTRLKTFSLEELLEAINRFSKDKWWVDNNSHRGLAWFFKSDDRIEQFLNLKEKKSGVIKI